MGLTSQKAKGSPKPLVPWRLEPAGLIVSRELRLEPTTSTAGASQPASLGEACRPARASLRHKEEHNGHVAVTNTGSRQRTQCVLVARRIPARTCVHAEPHYRRAME
jgi:hypothetical protein